MSAIEQKVPEGVRDRFQSLELGDERFALVYIRLQDPQGKPADGDLDTPFAALQASLEQDGDPGLAANLALEALCQGPFAGRLECAILMFEPRHMTVTAYNAGCRDTGWWVSHELGSSTHVGGHHDALERRMLRKSGDHFTNDRTVHLASGDVFVVVSAGFAGRGGKGQWPTGIGTLTDVLNEHIGEEPLRVVTLVKNAFWEKRSKHRDGAGPPVGDVKIAAVRAIPPPLATKIPGDGRVETHLSRKFETAIVRGPRDRVRLCPLHSDRRVLIWMSPAGAAELTEPAFETGVQAILSVLDGTTGDNDNPREAGRDAFEAMKLPRSALRMAVIQYLDLYGRVKSFRSGWHQPISLGNRGIRDHGGQQQFNEGSEATVNPGGRLFFPGPLEYEGEHHQAESLAEVWPGGKASRLYETLTVHWKTKNTAKALERLVLAAASDADIPDAVGIALVTGLEK